MFETAEYHFYSALSQAACCEAAGAGRRRHLCSMASATEEHIEALVAHHRQLEIWAENCPENFENRVALVSAEIARIEGHELDAERLYEKAIRSAHDYGFVQNEALANELAARFYAARGFETVCHAYLRNAWHCYQRWGATGKLRQLEELYPNLRKEASVPGPGSTMGAPVESLDLATVIKVSQAVSGEIVLSKLINELMRIALEQAGAERGLLIFTRGKERRIEAEANSERDKVRVRSRQSLVTPADLPESLLRYVIRTQESVTLRDASVENLFSQDEYIRQKHPRSVFCLPLIKQGKLVGVLYLENNLAPGVFTSKQLAILELIASEAAISLEQAHLYAELTQENSERRKVEKALRASEERWRKLFENSSAGIALIALDGRLFAANYAFQKMLGYTEQELHRLTSLDLTIEEDRPADEALRAEAVAGQWRDYRVERRFRRKDGSAVWTDVSAVYVPVAESESGFFSAVIVDISERKQAEEMQIAIAHEREILMRQRAADLAKANEALRSCLDALASVTELDAFIGQVMATITRQLCAISSNLRVLDADQKGMRIELIFQDGSVMSPADAGYPERFQSLSLEGIGFSSLQAPYTVLNLSGPRALEIPADLRAYLQGLGVRTLLIIPLVSQGHINGLLNFRFAEERDFQIEELEIARALATQASLAIHLTELATSAKQSAVLEERTRLAGEIHDSLAQSFTGITMQLEMAKELKTDEDNEVFNYVERANDLARFGLAEARRSVLSLHSMTAKDSGLIGSLQTLAERSNIAGRLRCTFRSNLREDESVPVEIRQDLLRIAQEAISNALRHAKSTAISLSLRSDQQNLILKVKDNGIGITKKAETKEGFGFVNMRARVKKLKGTLDIRTVPGRGTSISVSVPFKQELA
jgi:PAS domain S-box-containing protein